MAGKIGDRIQYRIYQESTTGWNHELKRGYVNALDEEFKAEDGRHHVDRSRLLKDKDGTEFLAFGQGHFEPLVPTTAPVKPIDEPFRLEPRGSFLAEQLLAGKGWMDKMVKVASGKNRISWLAILICAVVGVAAFSSGYTTGFVVYNNQKATPNVYTSVTGNKTLTYTSYPSVTGGATTQTVTSISAVTVPQFIVTTTTATATTSFTSSGTITSTTSTTLSTTTTSSTTITSSTTSTTTASCTTTTTVQPNVNNVTVSMTCP